MNNKPASSRKPAFSASLKQLLPLWALLFSMAGCSKSTDNPGNNTLDKNIFLDISVDGKTYSNYGYFENNLQPSEPETQYIITYELKEADSILKTVVEIHLSDQLSNAFPLGQVNAYLSFYKPGTGITGNYRATYFHYNGWGAGNFSELTLPSWPLINVGIPNDSVEFNITNVVMSGNGTSYAEGDFDLYLHPDFTSIAKPFTGRYRLYLKK